MLFTLWHSLFSGNNINKATGKSREATELNHKLEAVQKVGQPPA
jgi:hypothetical protein